MAESGKRRASKAPGGLQCWRTSFKILTNSVISKEVATLKKQLEDYKTEILFPLAQERIEIDLDDGVKHNYTMFSKVLKKIPRLDG